LDSLRVIVIQAIGEATTVIASRRWCSVAIADVRDRSTGRKVADHGCQRDRKGLGGTGKGRKRVKTEVEIGS
jgi:hypothetical protein